MFRLSSLFVVSCALLSTFALPSISSPFSSSTSFVVAAPSHALLRDTRLTDQLNRVLFEINSVLDSEYHNEDDEEQEELEDEQEIEQSASDDPLEDLPAGDQIIGAINEAAVEFQEIPANDEKSPRSKKTGGLVRFGRGARNLIQSPIKTSRQWYNRVKQYHSPDARQLRRENKFERMQSKEAKRRDKYDSSRDDYFELRQSPDIDELQRGRFGRWFVGVADKVVDKLHSSEMKQRTRIDSAHAARREKLAARRERLTKAGNAGPAGPTPPEAGDDQH